MDKVSRIKQITTEDDELHWLAQFSSLQAATSMQALSYDWKAPTFHCIWASVYPKSII